MGTGCEALTASMRQPVFDVIKLSMERPTEKSDVFLQRFFFPQKIKMRKIVFLKTSEWVCRSGFVELVGDDFKQHMADCIVGS